MKRRLLLGLPWLLAATPAWATGGFECRTTDRSAIVLGGSFGNALGTPIDAVYLELPGRRSWTADRPQTLFIVRSWFDEQEIRVDLTDQNGDGFAAQLRARFGRGGVATGTLLRDGIRHPARCELEDMSQ
jgi:hypothetical protein